MNALNPALSIAGPCIIEYKGKGIYSKADVPVTLKEDLTDIPSSAYGPVGKIGTNQLFEVKLTPVGHLDTLAELYPTHLRNLLPGSLVHHAIDVGTISTATGIVTKAAHGFREGAMVRVDTFGVMPAGWSASTLYYLHALTTGTYTLHTTAAHAAAGTSPVTPTTVGTGRHRIIEQEALTIWSINEQKGYIFHNAAITSIPGFKAASTETAIKEVGFTMYRKHGADAAADANAFFTPTTVAPTVTFDPDAIVISPYELQWGSTAPWAAMSTATGVEIDFAMSTTPVTDQAGGIVSHRVDSITPTAKARPRNVTEDDVIAKRVFQGSGAGNGRRISGGDDLHIVGTDLYVVLYNCALTDSPVGYDGKEDRVRDLTWTAMRKFTAGVPEALYYVGATAP